VVGDPWRQLTVPDTLVSREDESSTLTTNCAHEREPSVSTVGCWGKIDIDILGVQTLSKQRHEVFPANSGGDGKLHSIEYSCDGFQ
jgi:hypothetical protein